MVEFGGEGPVCLVVAHDVQELLVGVTASGVGCSWVAGHGY